MSKGKKKSPPKGGKPTRPTTSSSGLTAFMDAAKKSGKSYKTPREGAAAYEADIARQQGEWDQSYDHGGAYHAKGGDSGPAKGKSTSGEAKARMSHVAGAKRVNKSHSGLQSPHDMSIKDLFNL